ncbi:DNA methyltransferase [Candidatus Peribacteria bacterium RIFCSPLOWO2_01_FULL_54_110]|nr:MAG: DNA methyltransferase [Candidatus Peribacteria bacterium RIFCSPLOWO2_01_FULL_54_110]
MSRQLITQYQAEVEKIIQYGGSRNETAIRSAFQNLLSSYVQQRDLLLIPELEYRTKTGRSVNPDGTIKDAMRLDWGYWESKDQKDDLDEEIAKKISIGYPTENTIFEDSKEIVLYQKGQEALRASMKDIDALHHVLQEFIHYERPEVATFHQAIKNFKEDLPQILTALREMIEKQRKENENFREAHEEFLMHCQEAIDPSISTEDTREMIIQHILTEEIFLTIFGESHFHRENNVARELMRVVDTFFNRTEREHLLSRIGNYYNAIKAAAAEISNNREKQQFLKIIYEHFYKAYNPKSADTLGIVYTPGEIVHFMTSGANTLLHRHFGKLLGDENVEILDPATGTGTFIAEIIEHLDSAVLPRKYREEIHCNEIEILPYYIANLNIEFTYKQKMGTYEEFKNICFVDTLEQVPRGSSGSKPQQTLGFGMSSENKSRIERQNSRRISIVIGNPPYNAQQANENMNNKNKAYSETVDQRIKDTYLKRSNAQKNKLQDPYVRFFRWASDRLEQDGILVFITNSSFIEAKGFDGFRKCAADEFAEIYVLDLGGDVRKNPKLSGTKHNVFKIQTGVAISFMIKKRGTRKSPCKIFYASRPEMETCEEKLMFLQTTPLERISFTHIQPDKNGNWLNITDNDWDDLLPLVSKETKLAKSDAHDRALFKLYSLGVATNRDEWVYDFDQKELTNRIKFHFDEYRKKLSKFCGTNFKDNELDTTIKWTRDMKKNLRQGNQLKFDKNAIRMALYRPFVNQWVYFDKSANEMQYQLPQIFPDGKSHENIGICSNGANGVHWNALAIGIVVDLNTLYGGAQCVPLYRYEEDGTRAENVTRWGLDQFRKHYKDKTISSEDIFHYIYAVFHNPAYKEKYAINLKRELPRIPFYEDFRKWVSWGKKLIELHIGFEDAKPYPLKRKDSKNKAGKPKLKTVKENGEIIIDEITTLSGIPAEAWKYKLGNRSALEWILDQYKEKKPKDPTILEKFNTYRFSDYKEHVIELLRKIATVSVETIKIQKEINAELN